MVTKHTKLISGITAYIGAGVVTGLLYSHIAKTGIDYTFNPGGLADHPAGFQFLAALLWPLFGVFSCLSGHTWGILFFIVGATTALVFVLTINPRGFRFK